MNTLEFAQVVGRARMYKHLPAKSKTGIEPILLGDQQLSAVVRNYYEDENFAKAEDDSISLWKLYNLLTGVNKSSYIDQFLERTVNANDFVQDIAQHKTGHIKSWFMG